MYNSYFTGQPEGATSPIHAIFISDSPYKQRVHIHDSFKDKICSFAFLVI